jgi:thymidylate synthase ThyX
MIEAEIVADSMNMGGERITTFVLTFPRIILSEFNTHRMFSRNSASSRAIPFAKMVESVTENPFIPVAWQKSHRGMQGSDYHNEEESKWLVFRWLTARDNAVEQAQTLNGLNVSKQICNRLLEPFMWQRVICTSTSEGLNNFFDLRSNEAAEIHIQELALKMQEALLMSSPVALEDGQWHLPFGESVEDAVASCARVSYTTVGDHKKFTKEENISLCKKLYESNHASPFEHVAMSAPDNNYYYNLRGWMSLRYLNDTLDGGLDIG